MSDMKLSEQLQRDFGEIEECAHNQKGYAEKARALEKKAKLWDELDLLGKHDCS